MKKSDRYYHCMLVHSFINKHRWTVDCEIALVQEEYKNIVIQWLSQFIKRDGYIPDKFISLWAFNALKITLVH